jgi:uncharacterized phiE125 gp8 family phage protein
MSINLNDNALTDLATTKSFLKVTTTTDDDIISILINACSTAIENYCRRSFYQQVYTNDMYDGNGTKWLNLKNYPVQSVSQVQVNGVTIDPANYVIKNETGVLCRIGPYPNTFTGLSISRFSSLWNQGDYNIAVSYTAGFATIPDDLAHACRVYVKSIYNSDVANFSTTFSDGFVFKADAMPTQVRLMLAPYADTSGGIR